MLNPSLDAYGSKPLAAVQKIASGQKPLVAPANAPGTAGAATAADKPAQPISKEALDAAVEKLNKFIAPTMQTIEFSMDSELDRMVVKVVDTATRQVLRQIPNEEVLAISRTLDKLQGLVIRQTA